MSAVDLTCTEGGVELTGNGKTRDSLLVVKLKAESLSVMAQSLNVGKLEVNPVTGEDLGAVLELDSSRGGAGAVAVETDTGTGETDSDVDRGEVGLLGSRLGSLGSALSRVLAEALVITQQLVRPVLLHFFFLFRGQLTIKRKAYLLQGLRTAETLASEHCDFELNDGIRIGGGKMELFGGGPEGEEIGRKADWRSVVHPQRNDAIAVPDTADITSFAITWKMESTVLMVFAFYWFNLRLSPAS